VKITVMFRGREVAYAQQGQEMLRRIIKSVEEYASPESYPKLEGRRMIMVLGPSRNFENYKKTPALVNEAEFLASIAPKPRPTPQEAPAATPPAATAPEATATAPAAATATPETPKA
jgi:translation initiation factor IF-3